MRGRTRFGRLMWLAVLSLLVGACASAPEQAAVEQRPPDEERTEEQAPPERAPETWTENPGPQLTLEQVRRVTVPVPSAWSESADVYALFPGVVHRYSNSSDNGSGFGRFVELAHETEVSIDGQTERSRYYTVYAGLEAVAVRPAGTIPAGGAIGTAATGDTGVRVGVYTRDDDPIWRRQTRRPPIILDGFYFWDPSFVLSPP